PFIYMNATGTESDVRTLLHESGHAFHSFEAQAAQPLVFQRHPGSEMAEVASMSMELLAAPYLGEEAGGFFSPEDERRSRAAHLEAIPLVLAPIASVDAFQHWIYTSGEGHDRDARDRRWLQLRERFQPGVDWSGLDELRTARWLAQPHFFTHPFYYIEYGIAQLGALQVWRNSMADQDSAVAAYRGALALGGTRPLSGLFEAAGARLVFDAEQMGELVALVEEQLATRWNRRPLAGREESPLPRLRRVPPRLSHPAKQASWGPRVAGGGIQRLRRAFSQASRSSARSTRNCPSNSIASPPVRPSSASST